MFYLVLLMIALTNFALGYVVANHFGFRPDLAAAMAQVEAKLPSFTILGGGDETPLDQLPPAEPVDSSAAKQK
jgi:hypothetical protein